MLPRTCAKAAGSSAGGLRSLVSFAGFVRLEIQHATVAQFNAQIQDHSGGEIIVEGIDRQHVSPGGRSNARSYSVMERQFAPWANSRPSR